MSRTAPHLSASEAAARLGVSVKALRLYEQRGLLNPARSSAGWRTYGPAEMTRAARIASLRGLGLGLAQISAMLRGAASELAPALAAHQSALDVRRRELSDMIAKVHRLREEVARGHAPRSLTLADPDLGDPDLGDSGLGDSCLGESGDRGGGACARDNAGKAAPISFDLPWPWGGERFELGPIRSLTYITGPLGCGKTKLAMCLAQALPAAAFLGLERAQEGDAARARTNADPDLDARVDQTLRALAKAGAQMSNALLSLVVSLEADGPAMLVIDMIEDGLNQATQQALIASLRARGSGARPLFLLTRSSVILDLAAVGPEERILFCPANHSPPIDVAPCPGAAGYEAVATCLATPEVRARTAGLIAQRLPAA